MTFTTEEIRYLARWTSEVLDNRWTGHAHQLQKQHGATDTELGTMVAAWSRTTGIAQAEITDLRTEEGCLWPWSPSKRYRVRVDEARRFIESGGNG